MAEYLIQDSTLSGIADAVRTKRKTTAEIPVASLAAEILEISGGTTETLPEQVTLTAAANTAPSIVLAWENPTSCFAGILIVRKAGSLPTSPEDGEQVYNGTGTAYTDTAVTLDTTYFYRPYPYTENGSYQTVLRGYAEATVLSFPAEPTEYTLISQYTESRSFAAPEDGWFQIEVFGASGGGGSASAWEGNDEYGDEVYRAAGGGGGGGGAYVCSQVKLRAGDTVALVIGGIGTTVSAAVTSSAGESYALMQATAGAAGTNATAQYQNWFGHGGAGGVASGGNVANANGGSGTNGSWEENSSSSGNDARGGVGGVCGHTGGNSGGNGGRVDSNRVESPTGGSRGFVRIYRGNTNIV